MPDQILAGDYVEQQAPYFDFRRETRVEPQSKTNPCEQCGGYHSECLICPNEVAINDPDFENRTDVDTIIVGKATHAMGLVILHDIIHSVIVMRLANTLNGEPS